MEILDPATGTGSYICDIIEYLPRQVLPRKYKDELHANEVAILPYYIANLNIETAYAAKMGSYAPFGNICFVDTLDNTEALSGENQFQLELGSLSSENVRRIKQQNKRKISVIIGNPPYNANQQNENDNNKNRSYQHIDQRIKTTYIAASTAQKTKVYDMYARFIRWASDRLSEQGIVAFICNRSFIDQCTFDGFRKVVAQEFDHIYIVDTKSDVRANPKISGTKNNVFGIQTGVAIAFFVKDKSSPPQHPCRIFYTSMADELPKEEKLEFLSAAKIELLDMERIEPDADGNWLNTEENDFKNLLPLMSKQVKLARSDKAVCHLYSLGVVTARDAWAYDVDRSNLKAKIRYFVASFNEEKTRWASSNKKVKINDFVSRKIKWTSELESQAARGPALKFGSTQIISANYRPFTSRLLYFDKDIVHRLYQIPQIFGDSGKLENVAICHTDTASQKPFMVLAVKQVPDLHFVGAASGTCVLPLYRYDRDGKRHDNLTDWGLRQFQQHYDDSKITKRDIFHYTYAVLHHPAYRAKYEINLTRECPRLPFYEDFRQWTAWGRALMGLHLCYEDAAPFPLKRHDSRNKPSSKQIALLSNDRLRSKCLLDDKPQLKPKLKALKCAGAIEIDSTTALRGIPAEAWEYKLGNRSAMEWVLDQWKEHKISDPTVAEKFNTYRFADQKEDVIALLARVCTVSVETMKIVKAMP